MLIFNKNNRNSTQINISNTLNKKSLSMLNTSNTLALF